MTATLVVDRLSVRFPHPAGDIAAVRDFSIGVDSGECVGLVGESGSGKTQAFMAAMGLLPAAARIAGSVQFEGAEILAAPRAVLDRLRGSRMAMIFQDPMTSLTPHLTIGVQLAEVLVTHGGLSWRDATAAAARVLQRVRVPDARRRLGQYPHELSGGLRQRVMIGMSLLCEPGLLIADEPTTALDVTVQAEIIDLLRAMRRETRLAMVLVSHDLGLVAGLADRIAVMYAGRVVESGAAGEVLRRARHPYSALLLRCVPNLREPRRDRMPTLSGQPPSAAAADAGCAFAARCPRATQRCAAERPSLAAPPGSMHLVACHHPGDA